MDKFKMSEADLMSMNARLNSLSKEVDTEAAYDGVSVIGFSRCGTCGGAYNGNGCARNNCNGWD
ncbi:hypothetical protein [Ruminococcus callidus]|jgi:predicted metal-binding protein|uniref:hypothetical protein n=1 Tax=Ruminococcus callidus TaxID=40519 RepID=UPI003522C678